MFDAIKSRKTLHRMNNHSTAANRQKTENFIDLKVLPTHPLRTVDLFAGCGGLTLGLHFSGHKLLFAIEKDPMAFETFHANFLSEDAAYPTRSSWPLWLERRNHDIQELLSDTTIKQRLKSLHGAVDLVCGGPPCQGFSVGGIRDGQDSRNQLPYRYIEFVELVRPPYVLMENVEGMARKFVSKPGHVETAFVEWIRSRLIELGYDAHYEIIDASEFGVPQVRRRVFLFGVARSICQQTGMSAMDFFDCLREVRIPLRGLLGLPTNRHITVREAIDDLDGEQHAVCIDSPKFKAGTYKTARSVYAKLMREGIPNSSLPDSHRFSEHTPPILKFYRKVHADKMFGRLPKSYLIAHGTKKDKKVLIDPKQPASTITTHPDEFIHYRHPRNITVREMARIQSFPDKFVFRGRYTINGPRRKHDVARCSQVGNAVPPLVAQAIGWALHIFLRRLDLAKQSSRENKPKDQPVHCSGVEQGA